MIVLLKNSEWDRLFKANEVLTRVFLETDKFLLKFIFSDRNLRMAKTILTKKNKVGRISLPNSKTLHHWNKRENPRNKHV